MEIVQESWVEYCHKFCVHFEYDDAPGRGFGFDCDEHGAVDVDKLNSAAKENYSKCLEGIADGHPVHLIGIHEYNWSYKHPRIIKCPCGEEVDLDHHFTNSCGKCGRDYDGSGNELAPRHLWGEETGEHFTDIVNMSGVTDDNY
jgi:hypothetical protein